METFRTKFKSGDIKSNKEICLEFLCSPQGGMRRSLKTNSLVLITNPKSMYPDRWDDQGILHYSGMGQSGDQSLEHAQNKTLANSHKSDVLVFLFEVDRFDEYKFMGQVKLHDKPYPKSSLDKNGNHGVVWIFPLQIIKV